MYTTYKDTVGPVVGSVALRLTLDIMCYINVECMMLCCSAYRYGFPIYIVPRDFFIIQLLFVTIGMLRRNLELFQFAEIFDTSWLHPVSIDISDTNRNILVGIPLLIFNGH
jgi:hypothetical protein